MPRRSSYKKRRRRRSFKKRRFSKKKRLRFMKKGGRFYNVKRRAPLANKTCVLMRYAPVHCFVLGDGTTQPANMLLQNQTFSCNGIYDPNISSTLEQMQPNMFDQYKTWYRHYTVIGAQIKCRFSNQDPTNPAVVGVRLTSSKSVEMDARHATEGGNAKYAVLGVRNAGPDSSCELSYRVNPAKYLGISKPLSSHQLEGTASTNPIEQCYFQIFATSQGYNMGCPTVHCQVTIEYRVVWREPMHVGLSVMGPNDTHDHPTLENSEQVADHTHDFNDVVVTEGAWGDPDTATGTTEGVNPPS